MTEFQFWIGQGASGDFYAYRDVEPQFCYICETEVEAIRKAEETLKVYLHEFRNQQGATVKAAPLSTLPSVTLANKRAYELQVA